VLQWRVEAGTFRTHVFSITTTPPCFFWSYYVSVCKLLGKLTWRSWCLPLWMTNNAKYDWTNNDLWNIKHFLPNAERYANRNQIAVSARWTRTGSESSSVWYVQTVRTPESWRINTTVSMFHRTFFNSIIDKHQHIHFFTFNTILV